MKAMVRLTRVFALAATSLLLGAVLGCNSRPSSANRGNSLPAHTSAELAAASGSPHPEKGTEHDPGIDLQCLTQRIRKAPAPFHWSYKKAVPPLTNADWEADIGPDSVAGTFIGSSGARAIHAVRSDSTSWNTAVLVLSGQLPASTFALVNNSSAVTRAGAENVNGENTIKYAIDTSRDTPADASLIKSVLGAKGFVKGSAWVTRDGCPVKFVLDVEQQNNDGTLQREHYEANVTQR